MHIFFLVLSVFLCGAHEAHAIRPKTPTCSTHFGNRVLAYGHWSGTRQTLSLTPAGQVEGWDEETGTPTLSYGVAHKLYLHHHPLQLGAFSFEGRTVAGIFAPNRLRVYATASGALLWEKALRGSVVGLAFDHTPSRVVVSMASGHVLAFDAETGLLLQRTWVPEAVSELQARGEGFFQGYAGEGAQRHIVSLAVPVP